MVMLQLSKIYSRIYPVKLHEPVFNVATHSLKMRNIA